MGCQNPPLGKIIPQLSLRKDQVNEVINGFLINEETERKNSSDAAITSPGFHYLPQFQPVLLGVNEDYQGSGAVGG